MRTLRADDWRLWRGLRLRALTESPASFGSVLADWSGPGDTEARWRARLTDVPFNVIVYRHGIAAGMVGGREAAEGVVELMSMWVAPFARGRGVADAAVGAVVDWADGRDVTLSVKAHNRPAIGLYRRHGFVDVGVSSDGRDERRMWRSAGGSGAVAG
ncbi:GNAT family N-acetyltransferase [Nocardia bovistercoris]|uniref:GNAT family N-acetyltransferase n=1 Tax=Nocardia bovistercoris TaxID=2785916 RepID=A0A931IH39_9NOCA|nr:GNAT family N-acetyltransferase [Nocardia bovistercoris]